MVALKEVRESLDDWNGPPIRSLHTCISLASLLPAESEVSLDRKTPDGRLRLTRATLASEASDLAVASYCV
jgi:hypothetical protein